jgi:hypothetical protein
MMGACVEEEVRDPALGVMFGLRHSFAVVAVGAESALGNIRVSVPA